jgi:hypothetical protein
MPPKERHESEEHAAANSISKAANKACAIRRRNCESTLAIHLHLLRLEGVMKTPMQFFRTQQEKGAIGYILLWAMGVPVSLLAIVFLLRGCN